jgi:hypothetical protein
LPEPIIHRVNLRRFEDWLARLLEGGLGRLLGAKIQPVDIAKRLVEYMEDHRTVGAGRLYVPNNYRVYLAPETRAGFARFEATLNEELAAYVRAVADERDYQFVGRVRVAVIPDHAVAHERMRIEADLVDTSGLVLSGSQQRTEAIAIDRTAGRTRARPVVLVSQDRSVRLPPGSGVGLGRALDNDVIIDDPSVSRHHARLVDRGGSWHLEDLGSSRGTYVNGRLVASGYLRPGDEIRLGSALVRLELADEGEGPT